MLFKEFITVKNIIFIVLLLLVLKFLSQISAIAIMFFAAFVISCSLNPVVDLLSKKYKKLPRAVAASLVLTVTFLVSALFLVPVIYVAGAQITGLINQLPQKIADLQEYLVSANFFGKDIIEMIDPKSAMEQISSFGANVIDKSITATMNFFSAVVGLFAIAVIVYYLIADKDTIRNGIILFFPKKMKEKAGEIFDTISRKVGGYVIAQLVTITSVGLIVTVALLLLRVDYAVLLGVITAIMDLVPVIGPAIALAICIVMCYQMGPVTIVLVIVAYLIAQWAENNLVRPVVFGKFMDLHPLIVIFSLFVTAQFWGVLGVIFAPAIAATACVLLDELYVKPINDERK